MVARGGIEPLRGLDFLALGKLQGIAIIKPGEFWQRTTG